jgi:hypothetical protein
MAQALVDPADLTVDGEQYEAFMNALVGAFSDYASLAMMTRFRLDLPLATVAGENTPLDQVAFRLIEHQKSRGHFLRLVAAARASRPGNPQLAFFAEQFDLAIATRRPPELERIIKSTSSFLDIAAWRERLGEIEARVCRVEVTVGTAMTYGTGFLVGDDLVLTNHHVVEAVIAGEQGRRTASGQRAALADIVLRFDYVQTRAGIAPGTEVKVAAIVDYGEYSPIDLQPAPRSSDPDPDALDYALLRLQPGAGGKPFGALPIGGKAERDAPPRGAIAIPAVDWRFEPKSPLFIVQHPAAAPLKLAFESEAILAVNGNGTRVTYTTNTLGGSSGSPCFNQHLELVALHHAGDPDYTPMYAPTFNEGVPIAAIRERVTRRGAAAGIRIE